MWDTRHLRVLQGVPVNTVPLMQSTEYLTQYRRDYMPYLSEDYYLNDPRPHPEMQPQYTNIPHTFTQQQEQQTIFTQPFTQQQHTYIPDPPLFTQQQHTYTSDPPSFTFSQQQQHNSTPQQQPFTQHPMSMSISDSDFVTPIPQTRNFFNFDHDTFESPGTQRFNDNFRNLYQSGDSTQPQPTQQPPHHQEYTWAQLSGDYLNSTWAQGQGSASAPVEPPSPATAAQNFLGLQEDNDTDNEELFGLGLRPRNRPPCDTGGQM